MHGQTPLANRIWGRGPSGPFPNIVTWRLEHANNAYNLHSAPTCGRPHLHTRLPSRVHGQTPLANRIWGRGPSGPLPNIVTWRLQHAGNAYNLQTASTCDGACLHTKLPSRVHGQTPLANRIWGRGPSGPLPNIVTWRLQHAGNAYNLQTASTCDGACLHTKLPSCVHGQTPLANRIWGRGPSGPFPNIVTWRLQHADNAYNLQTASTCDGPHLQTRQHSRVYGQTPLANRFWGRGPSGPFPNIVTWRLQHADNAYNLQTASTCDGPHLQTRQHSRVYGQTPLANRIWGRGPSGPLPNIVTWRLQHAGNAYNLQTASTCDGACLHTKLPSCVHGQTPLANRIWGRGPSGPFPNIVTWRLQHADNAYNLQTASTCDGPHLQTRQHSRVYGQTPLANRFWGRGPSGPFPNIVTWRLEHADNAYNLQTAPRCGRLRL